MFDAGCWIWIRDTLSRYSFPLTSEFRGLAVDVRFSLVQAENVSL